ncbi:MAG: energy transducer TonB [Candidatus Kapabacteria bacterium]|jgi:protein TonB|nr:energy transducer TonB [Candidatus Kapabacteria bacterium]
MRTNKTTIVIPIRPYGAAEIKRAIEKNTFRGLMVTIALLTTMFIGSCAFSDLIAGTELVSPITGYDGPIHVSPFPVEQVVPPPLPPIVRIFGSAKRAGYFVPVTGMEMDVEDDIASIDELPSAFAQQGDHMPTPDEFAKMIEKTPTVEIKEREKEKVIATPFGVEEEPVFSVSELTSNVVYPQLAIRAKIEGTVIVGVIIDKTGKPTDAHIISSKHSALNKAALTAVMKTMFRPAIQNRTPVACIIQIPVEFRLTD